MFIYSLCDLLFSCSYTIFIIDFECIVGLSNSIASYYFDCLLFCFYLCYFDFIIDIFIYIFINMIRSIVDSIISIPNMIMVNKDPKLLDIIKLQFYYCLYDCLIYFLQAFG